MPKNPRQHYKRELERACNNLDMYMAHCKLMQDAYKEHHPEIADVLQEFMERALELQEHTTMFANTI